MTENLPDQEKVAFAKRLAHALTSAGHTVRAAALARAFNALFRGAPVTPHACRKWLLGESIPTQDKLVVLAQHVGRSADWLRYGAEAQMEAGIASAHAAPTIKKDRELLEAVHKLSERDQKLVAAMVRELSSNSNLRK